MMRLFALISGVCRLCNEGIASLESEGDSAWLIVRSLVVSGLEAVSKLFRSKLRSNPRPQEGKALGWMSASLQIPEAAFKVCWHDRVSARCCVWSGKAIRHLTLKPKFEAKSSSRLSYLLSTVVAQLSVLELDAIVIPMESEPALVRAAVPKGYTNVRTSAADFIVIEKAVVDNSVLEPPTALLDAQHLNANMHGTVIGRRCFFCLRA
jgi:hypothetical protein